jgi:hypothetical protein
MQVCSSICVCSYYYICVRMLLHKSAIHAALSAMCPICVFSYYYICVRMLLWRVMEEA